MPFSPLIRPLSPLQTQSAPTLPDPFNLSDSALNLNFNPANDAVHVARLSSPAQQPQRDSRGSNRHERSPLTSASPSSSPAPPQISDTGAALRKSPTRTSPTIIKHDYNDHTVVQGSKPRTGSLSATHTHSHVNRVNLCDVPPAVHTSGASTHARHPLPFQTPKPLLPSTLCSRHSSPVTTSPSHDAAAATTPPSYPSTHPYANQYTASPSFNESGLVSKRREATTATPHASVRPQQPTSLFSSLSHVPAAAAVLHASTATVAVAASHPSYGASLLRHSRGSPGRTCINFERRSPSPPPTASVHFTKHAGSSGEGTRRGTARLRAAHGGVLFPFDLSAAGFEECETVSGMPSEVTCSDAAEANCYRGTAVSRRTGRLYNIAIEASPLEEGKRRKGARSNNIRAFKVNDDDGDYDSSTQAGRRKITSVLYDQQKQHQQQNLSQDTSADERTESDTETDENRTEFEQRNVRQDGGVQLERTRRAYRTTSPLLTRTASPASPCPSPHPAAEEATQEQITSPTPPSAAAPFSVPAVSTSYPRYVYPVLDECQRLLQEIQTHSPLMRRCLTPPRPLLSSANTSTGTSSVAPAAAASASQPAPFNAAGIDNVNNNSAPQAGLKGRLGPGPDARRLYAWDSATAAADLSFADGPLQQPADRFAMATARQLRRLRDAGVPLYDSTGSGASTAQSSTRLRASPRQFPSDGAALRFTAVTDYLSYPREVLEGRSNDVVLGHASVDADAPEVESSTGRLRRLLRETEAAFPVLWRATHMDPVTGSSSSPPPTQSNARGDDALAAGSGRTDVDAPPFSALQASQKEPEMAAKSSDGTLSRVEKTLSLSSEEHGLRWEVSSLTPARPPPPAWCREDAPQAVS